MPCIPSLHQSAAMLVGIAESRVSVHMSRWGWRKVKRHKRERGGGDIGVGVQGIGAFCTKAIWVSWEALLRCSEWFPQRATQQKRKELGSSFSFSLTQA